MNSQDKTKTYRESAKQGPATLNKTPGASGYATGGNAEIDSLYGKLTPKTSLSAMSKYAKTRHKSAARVLGYALTTGDFEGYEAVSAVWAARLTDRERASIAWASLRALDAFQVDEVYRSVALGAGMPSAPLMGPMQQAAFWADLASESELKAYALACFHRMPPAAKAAFLKYAGKQAHG